MSKIVRYEFMGNVVAFWLFCATIVLIPLAIIYLVNGTLRIEHDVDVDDPEKFVEDFRAGKLKK